MKAEVDKLDINKLVNVPTSLNNLKIKVDDLDVGQSRTVPIDMKKVKWCSEERNCEKQKVQHTQNENK